MLFITAAQAHRSFSLSAGCTHLMPGLAEDAGSEEVKADRGVAEERTGGVKCNIKACEPGVTSSGASVLNAESS